jgi:hypothetical protein
MVMAVGIVKLFLTIFSQYTSSMIAQEVSISDTLAFLILAFISCLVLRQVPTIAASLSNGFALETYGAFGKAMKKIIPSFKTKEKKDSKSSSAKSGTDKGSYKKRFSNSASRI